MNKINRHLVLLTFPLIVGFLMFYIIPLLGSIRYSFVESAFTQNFVGIKNYMETMMNQNFLLSIKNTFELLTLGVPLLVIVSLCLALLVKSMGDRLPVLRVALILPMLLPSAAVSSVFGKLVLENPRIPLLAIYVWKNTGFLMLIFLAALSMIPQDVYEAAALDGAKKSRIFFCITLPMIAGALLFSAVLAVSYNLRLFREAYLLYGAYPNSSIYLTQHYMNNHFYKLNYQKLTSSATIFSLTLFIFIWLGVRLSRRMSGE